MASQVEKYELILSADPRSRIFVDLARALLERGDHERAAEVIRAGLVHHPESVPGRVLLGRAYLSLRRPSEAVAPLAEALARAPADARIKLLLDQAQAAVAAAEGPAAGEGTPLPQAIQSLLVEEAPPGGSFEPTGSIPLDEPLPPRPPAARPRPPPPPRAAQQPPPAPAQAEAPPAPPSLPGPSKEEAAPRADTPADEKGALKHLPKKEERKQEATTSPGLPLVSEEAARIAAKYEHELREKMNRQQEPAERSHRSSITLVVLVAVAVLSAVTFYLVRRAYRERDARAAVAAARAGLARDTLGSLSEAAHALQEASAVNPAPPEAKVLDAEVAALLWTDFADEKALERARALDTSPEAGEGALVARYLTAPGPAERERAAAALVAAAPGAGPLVGILAAGVLRGRGDREGARRYLEAAARATPPMLRALADLGDMTRAAGDPEEALRLYRLALQAHPTHPRSVLGAAEVRMALSRGLEESLAEVEAMDKDPQSPPPGPDRLRAELVHARLLFALGRRDDAVRDLAAAGGRFPGRPEVPAAVAEMEMARGAFDRAEVAAERAASISPGDPAMKELLARVRLGRGRYRELLQETEGTSSRALRLIRAQARVDLGEWDRARAELEATRRDGRMSPEAAAWMAFCDAATGRRPQAVVILQALDASRDPPPMAGVARGRLLGAEGKHAEAEKVLRTAAAAPGAPFLAQAELASAVRAQGRAAEAAEILGAALARNPFHARTRLERARARLDMRDARGAAEDARKVLEDHPRDAEAQRLLDSIERPAPPRKAKRPGRRRR
jgi:tetratricopeptide (TPR) repeat protein